MAATVHIHTYVITSCHAVQNSNTTEKVEFSDHLICSIVHDAYEGMDSTCLCSGACFEVIKEWKVKIQRICKAAENSLTYIVLILNRY